MHTFVRFSFLVISVIFVSTLQIVVPFHVHYSILSNHHRFTPHHTIRAYHSSSSSSMTVPYTINPSYSSSSAALFQQQSWLEALFAGDFSNNNSREKKRRQLKQDLLKECKLSILQRTSEKETRVKIESILSELVKVRPIESTASSPLLRKSWNLVWTTEKEINFFINQGISSQISQTISKDGLKLSNTIEFRNGGGLYVVGTLSIENTDATTTISTNKSPNTSSPVRNYFQFDTATLDLTLWGTYSFPPVGQGWFDTIYLDEDLRCDVNSRQDILICTPLNKE